MLNVAIIDDGVNTDEVKVDYSWEIDRKSNIFESTTYNKITHESHGTTCLKIIKKYLNKDTSEQIIFHSIKIINSETISGNVVQFLKALEYCITLNIQIIHLSIGSSYNGDFDKIERMIKKLNTIGVIIIAALNNKKIITYPACLPCVIGVKTNESLKDDEYIYNNILDIDNIEIIASSKHILRNSEGFYISQISNSYAAPLVTSKVINYLLSDSNLSLDQIKLKLQQDSICKEINVHKYSFNEVEIPIIIFEDIPQYVLKRLISDLQKKFFENDYSCGIITQIDPTIIKFMNFDIALLDIKDITELNMGDISLIIRFNSNVDEINITQNEIYYKMTINEINANKIYENILRIL